ncbi:transcriptional regulator [Tepidibacillus sp. LV47]|uniref:transcriptional regulator n=1 Tax=Tepidibacillus sp. LV47 TaxID=3398228 RepID=UPI003AB01BBD
MIETKIRKATFKHIESELYSYHDTKKEINRLKNDIIFSSPTPDLTGGGKSNLPGDPTGRTVTLMLTHRKIEQLELIVSAISNVYDQLPNEKKNLIKLKYWTRPQTLTWEGIARELHVSRRQAIYWRDEIVYAIAHQLGWR